MQIIHHSLKLEHFDCIIVNVISSVRVDQILLVMTAITICLFLTDKKTMATVDALYRQPSLRSHL